MRAKSMCRYILAPLLVLSAAAAQELENITVLPFEGWTGNVSAAREYQNALTDKIATKIIQSHRFNVIDRSHLDKVLTEQDLQLTGLIDEATVVQMGKVLGVHKLIVGRFTRNSTEHHSAEYSSGRKISDAYYSAVVQTTIKLLDVQSGRYLEAAEAEGTGQGSDRRNALLNALDEVAEAVMRAFEQYFAIQAHITAVDKAMVTIDRGSIVGVQEGMDFLVFHVPGVEDWIRPETSASDQSIGVIRIVSAQSQTSRGRIMVGYDKIKAGHLVRESKEEITTAAMVLDKTGSTVIINAGLDLGIKAGMTFDVVTSGREITDPATGEVFRASPVNVGVIYITKPGARSSEAKIIKGQKKVDTGMWILERETATVSVSASLSAGLLSAAFEPNQVVDTFIVENKYTGSHEVAVDYSAYEDITSGIVVQLAGMRRDLVRGYSVGFAFNWFRYGSDLSAWALDLMATYDIDVIPDRLILSPGLRVGYGRATQKLPNGIVAQISDDESSALKSGGFHITPQVGLQAKLGNLTLTGEVAYRLWNVDTWTYDVQTGKKDDSGNDETESVELDSKLVPYPEVTIGGLYFSVGLSIEDFWSKITDLL
ncbi:MAG: hypothetical protein IID14_10335 [Candidatus Marinimicrobia bacterium]|nr:hypothetical protein [Candidatus Neomarinimicrobiota bacterium]